MAINYSSISNGFLFNPVTSSQSSVSGATRSGLVAWPARHKMSVEVASAVTIHLLGRPFSAPQAVSLIRYGIAPVPPSLRLAGNLLQVDGIRFQHFSLLDKAEESRQQRLGINNKPSFVYMAAWLENPGSLDFEDQQLSSINERIDDKTKSDRKSSFISILISLNKFGWKPSPTSGSGIFSEQQPVKPAPGADTQCSQIDSTTIDSPVGTTEDSSLRDKDLVVVQETLPIFHGVTANKTKNLPLNEIKVNNTLLCFCSEPASISSDSTRFVAISRDHHGDIYYFDPYKGQWKPDESQCTELLLFEKKADPHLSLVKLERLICNQRPMLMEINNFPNYHHLCRDEYGVFLNNLSELNHGELNKDQLEQGKRLKQKRLKKNQPNRDKLNKLRKLVPLSQSTPSTSGQR